MLPLELARGKLNTVRNQIADWEQAGFEQNEALRAKLKSAMHHFTEAAVRQHEPQLASMFAQDALIDAVDAAELTAQPLRGTGDCGTASERREVADCLRHVASGRRGTFEQGLTKMTAALCNTAVVPLVWRNVVPEEDVYQWDAYSEQLSWCQTQGMNTCAGPLVKLDDRGFPAWLNAWQDDVDAVAAFSAEYTRASCSSSSAASRSGTARRFPTARISSGSRTKKSCESSRAWWKRFAGSTPIRRSVVSFDAPWGEYLRKTPLAYAPIHIADHLVRSGLPIAAFGLEIEAGYTGDGSYLRDALELSKLIDTWSMLGVPLYVFLAAPSAESEDALAETRSQPIAGAWPGGWSPEGQAEWVREIVPMLLAKPSVQGIAWQQYRDDEPHELPHAGLIDERGLPKPVFAALTSIRKEHVL